MENRPLDTTNGNSSTHTHRIFSDASTPRVISPNSPTSQAVSKPPLQVSDPLDDSGEGNTPLQIKAVPTAERRNHGSAELQNEISKSFARSNGAYKRSRSNATNFTISNLFSRKLSKSVEEIVVGPRKEISATVLRANNLTHHNDVSFRYFALRMTHSKIFNRLMLFVILVNVLCIAFQNETSETHHLQKMFWMFSDIFTAVYTCEFAIKFYADRARYWVSVYNIFDFAILVVAYVDMLMTLISAAHSNKLVTAMRSLRAFRALKIVNFLPGVQVIASALVKTLKELVVDVILLLIILLFTFGVMGFYFFGYDAVNETVIESWGNLSSVFLSLFTVVTADSWWKFITELVDGGHSIAFSRAYIVTFLFFGHFITANLFIAVIITNIQSSSNDFKTMLLKEREVLVQDRKRQYWRRSRREVKMMSNRNLDGESNFEKIATEFYYSLQRRDFVVKSDLKTNILWVDTVFRELRRVLKSNRQAVFLQRDMVSAIGPVCNLSEVDRRKISISTESRFVVKHKTTGLQYLTTSNLSGKGGRKNSTLQMPDQQHLAPRLSIFRRKSKFGNMS